MTEQPPQTRNLKITVEYDGALFHGWQVQQDVRTVQQCLQKALSTLTNTPVKIFGAGRTDTGVHAEGQVAHFATRSRIAPGSFPRAVNGLLPDDISVLACEEVAPDFHARFSATGRIYRYRILRTSLHRPLERLRVWQVHGKLNVDHMLKASASLIGEFDFSSFAAAMPPDERMVRHLRRIEFIESDKELAIVLEASSFLRRMVRMLVGALVEVGCGKWPIARMAQVRSACNNQMAAQCAPAQGLSLIKVLY